MLFMRRLRLRCDAQIVEEGLHADAESLVVLSGSGPVRGLASATGTAGADDDRREDVVAQREQDGDGPGCVWRDVVAACPGWLDRESLAAELAKIVGGLPAGVAALPAYRAHLGGEFGDGEAVWRGGQRECSRESGADPGLVQVDASGAGGTDPGRQGQLVKGAIGNEADIGARPA